MRYSEEFINEVEYRNDIVDVIGQYVKLQKKGNNYFGLCPFHNEKSGSFSVSQSKQMYYCFGCGEGGNVITFLMKHENIPFVEALTLLAKRAGMELPEENVTPEEKAKRDRNNLLYAINKDAAYYYYRNLMSEKGTSGHRHFRKRAVPEETIKRFGLGYASTSSNGLVRYLKRKGYKDYQIIDAGLASFDEKKGLRDKFWGRVMFPIINVHGKIIGFGGRVLGDGKPKYLNSPETCIFNKGSNMYGLNYAKKTRAGYLILCEGYMDVIAMHSVGLDMAVAALGTAFTSNQASLMKRFTDTVLLAYDSDEAGKRATIRAIGILKEAGLMARVIDLQPCKDPDEFIKKLGKDAFEQRIKTAENSFMYEISVLKESYDMQDPTSKTEFQRKLAEKLGEFKEPLERNNYIEAVADRFHIPVTDLKVLVSFMADK